MALRRRGSAGAPGGVRSSRVQYGFLGAIVATIAVANFFAFHVERAGTYQFVLVLVAPLVVFGGYGVARAWRDGVLKDLLTVRSGDFSRGFAAAGVLFGLAYGASRVLATQGTPRESWLARIYLQVGDPSMLRKNVLLVVVVLAVLALAEELVWRGLVTSLLEEKIGSRRAWVWAAVLYAIAYAPAAWQLRDPVAGSNPLVPLAALSTGLVWGAMSRHFERLLPAVFSHVLLSWTVLMMFRLWGPSV